LAEQVAHLNGASELGSIVYNWHVLNTTRSLVKLRANYYFIKRSGEVGLNPSETGTVRQIISGLLPKWRQRGFCLFEPEKSSAIHTNLLYFIELLEELVAKLASSSLICLAVQKGPN
jgi:hypothetical protein